VTKGGANPWGLVSDMKRITHTLVFRLFLLIASLQTVILVSLAFAMIRVQQEGMMENVMLNATRVSEVIVRSMRYSMLLNRKEDVHHIVSAVGREPGFEGVRVYNKQGRIVFGTGAEDQQTTVDMQAEACVRCHSTTALLDPPPPQKELARIFSKPSGERVLGLITPIRNEPQCAGAGCHAQPSEKSVLGVLDVTMSLAQVDQAVRENVARMVSFSLAAMALIGAVAGGFLWFFIRRPVRTLTEGMQVVASGNLEHRVQISGNDELGRLARAFNGMTGELDRARREITDWSRTLEQRVREKSEDLERAHRRMLTAEKMASIGTLASSVAHELNNPMAGILTYSKLLLKRVDRLGLDPAEAERWRQELQLIADESQRCGTIVQNLLTFSRQRGVTIRVVRMSEILRRCEMLMGPHAAANNVAIHTSCQDDDVLECDPGQIQQVLVTLMSNSIEAMAGVSGAAMPGRMSVEVRRPGPDVLKVIVADTGPGMNEDVKARIFEPFFTTKSEGKGVGLGLSIAYGIIEHHHGSIEVETAPGSGARFIITLPSRHNGSTRAASADTGTGA
jgi:two-component system, NtrC family, sensor kinase